MDEGAGDGSVGGPAGKLPSASSDSRFAEVHVPAARARNRKGHFVGLGTPVEGGDVRLVKRALSKKDYRRYLEDNEHLALKVIVDVLKDKRVPAREKLQAAQDLLNRLHGRVAAPGEGGDAKKKLESMSTDELRDHVISLARDAGMRIESGDIN